MSPHTLRFAPFPGNCFWKSDESLLFILKPPSPQSFLIGLFLAGTLSAPAVQGSDVILGRIRFEDSPASSVRAGPVRWPSEFAMVFGEYLRAEQIEPASLTPASMQAILAGHHLVVTAGRDPKPVARAQWDPEDHSGSAAGKAPGSLVWINPPWSTGAGDFILRLRRGPAPDPPFSIEDRNNQRLLVKKQDRPVLQYNYGVIQELAGRVGPYDRACYLHPVWTPSGKIVTGDFSPEHIHQRGIFLAWRSAKFGDVETEFWGLGASKGRLLPEGTPPQVIQGPVFVRLIFQNQGVVGDIPVFTERAALTIYDHRFGDGWLFDFECRQAPVPGGPVMELPAMFYGGMSFRGPRHWLAKTSGDVKRALERGASFEGVNWRPEHLKLEVLTSEARDRISGDRTTARWIDYTGPFENGWGGLAMFDHPLNPRYPTPLRIHPELPYFSYALMQREPMTVTHDAPLRLRYRVWVHDGPPHARFNEDLSTSLAEPVALTWTPGAP